MQYVDLNTLLFQIFLTREYGNDRFLETSNPAHPSLAHFEHHVHP